MDSERFDSLVRSLGARHNRRSVVKSFGAAALGAAGMVALRGAGGAAPSDKVSICHLNEYGTYDYISVSSNARPAHEAHGDVVTNLDDVANCGGCGTVCEAPENATAFCENGCGFTCNEGYESDGAGGCAEFRNPAINVSFDPTGDSEFCWVQVDLVDFADSTSYPVDVQISYDSAFEADETYNATLTTDGDGFASGNPIGTYRELSPGRNYVRVISNGITTDWFDIEC